MSRRTLILVAAVWLGLAGFIGNEFRGMRRVHTEADLLAERMRQLETEAASLRQQRDTTTRDLAEATRQLAALPVPKIEDKTTAIEQRAEISAWLAKVKRLRGLFESRPDQRIPEMQSLTEEDWLRVGKLVNLDDEEDVRAALAQVRNTAVSAFLSRIGPALRRYVKEAGADRPASVQALAAFLESPADALLLDRYEIVDRSSSLRGEGAKWGIQNRAPIDGDYDIRAQASAMGNASNSGPMAWDPPLETRYRQALRNYTKANQGDYPKRIADAVPFFDPPLDRETAERLVRTDRRR